MEDILNEIRKHENTILELKTELSKANEDNKKLIIQE